MLRASGNDFHEKPKQTPQVNLQKVDAHSPPEACKVITQAGMAKAALPWADMIIKSFLGGVFISLGGLFDLIVAGGASGLRASNPSLATLLAAFVFPLGFVLIILTNTELATSNMFIMAFTTCQRRTSIWALLENWVVSYIFNLAGCLFFAGFLTYWSKSLSSDAEIMYSVTGAEGRVNVDSYWSTNFLRGVGCNWLVGLAYFLATESKDQISKIYSIWIPIWAFVGLGYQHCIANFFLVPIGMFYGTNFGVGEYIYKSVIPVTIGNIVGGGVFVGCAFWFLYGRNDTLAAKTGQAQSGHGLSSQHGVTNSDETLDAGRPGNNQAHYGQHDASDRV